MTIATPAVAQSPGHALCVNNVLIPVRGLIHSDAVIQVERGAFTYWHIELDSHDILLANGAPAESYLETGNRQAFDNAPGVIDLHPNFDARDTSRFCRPYVESGPLLTAARLRLFGASTAPATEPVHNREAVLRSAARYGKSGYGAYLKRQMELVAP